MSQIVNLQSLRKIRKFNKLFHSANLHNLFADRSPLPLTHLPCHYPVPLRLTVFTVSTCWTGGYRKLGPTITRTRNLDKLPNRSLGVPLEITRFSSLLHLSYIFFKKLVPILAFYLFILCSLKTKAILKLDNKCPLGKDYICLKSRAIFAY